MQKADEMELYINLKSIKIAWLFTTVYLLVWSAYDTFKTSQVGLPLILLIFQNLVFYGCQIYFRHRMAGGHEE